MKKILFIVNLDKFFVSHRLPIALAAQKNGYEIHIATNFTNEKHKLREFGFSLHQLPIERSSFNIKSNLKTFFSICSLYKTIKPDICHLITIKPILFGCLAAYFFKRLGLVISISGLGYIFSDRSNGSNFKKNIVSFLYRFAFNHKRIWIIFQNKDDKETLLRITNFSKENITIIPGSGIDLNIFHPTKTNKKNIVLFAGRLLVSKGIIDFIESSKYVKNAKFVVSGKFDFDNPDCVDPEFIYENNENGLIEYWGENNEMQKIINKSSLVVLPSYYGEGLPKILIEAAACGKPIITTDHPGCRESVINRKTGFLVPIKNPLILAKYIQKVLDNEELRINMGKEARIFAKRKFSINKVVEKHLKIYSKIIKQ